MLSEPFHSALSVQCARMPARVLLGVDMTWQRQPPAPFLPANPQEELGVTARGKGEGRGRMETSLFTRRRWVQGSGLGGGGGGR